MFGADVAQAQQFQERHKGDDDLAFGRALGEEFPKTQTSPLGHGEAREQARHLVGHGPPVKLEVAKGDGLLGALEDGAEGLHQLLQANIAKLARGRAVGPCRQGLLDPAATKHRPAPDFQHAEALGRLLEALVFHQLADEVQAWVELLGIGLLPLALLLLGQEHPALDDHQGGGHHDELAGHVDVQRAHLLKVGQILRGDAADGDVVDVHLLLANEVEEEVKGPLEGLEGDLVVVEERQSGVQDALGGD